MQRMQFSLIFAAAVLAIANHAPAAAPPTSDPDARLIAGFDQPGTFPTTVTATNINIAPRDGAELDGANEDFLTLSFPSAGPIAWTSSRANNGDLAVSIGPADPNDPRYFPPTGELDNYQAMNLDFDPIDPNSPDNELTTLAWRVSNATGALFATTRHNGVDDGYTISGTGGTAAGTIRGVSYFNVTAGQGWAFQMVNGEYANTGPGSSDLQTGHFGDGGGSHEAAFDVAAAYFPYDEGWKGAWVQSEFIGPATFVSSSPLVDESEVNWDNDLADIQLTGVNSAEDGMLFVAPSNGSSTTRIASAFPNEAGGWTTTVRLDDDADTTGGTFLGDGNDFQFLYVPYSTQNLVGAHVDGATGNSINSAGDTQFSLTRTAAGDFTLSVFEADGETKKDEDAGMLILSVADTMAENNALGSRAAMSYEYEPESGDFLIQSRELVDISSATPDDGFGNEFAGSDSNFYFAWVDFENPMSLPTGDFNGDGFVGQGDLDLVLLNWGDEVPPDAVPDGWVIQLPSGLIGQGNLDDVLLNWGSGVPPSGTPSTTPEPTTAVLLLGLLSIAGIRRSRSAA